MQRRTPIICLVLALAFAMSASAQIVMKTISTDPVKIDSGLIAGKLLHNGVRAYLGVPYGAPPVGQLRFREPQPVTPWEGVYNADRFGPKCPQTQDITPEPMSEDCLYLNIWAPAGAKPGDKLPVILYFHGGGYTGNSGARPFYNGQTLASKGVIHVTMNFRLGPFAEFASPELTAESPYHSSGNLVRFDQFAAMKWIKRNIAAFGGDPDNLTLMGLSNGGVAVSYLMASGVTRGYYQRVVGLSGSVLNSPMPVSTLAEAEEAGLKFQAAMGAKNLAEMRALPMLKILAGAPGVNTRAASVDGYFLSEQPSQVFAEGKQVDVPVLLGRGDDEQFIPDVSTVAEFRAAVEKAAGPKAEELLKLYPVTNDADVTAVATKMATDAGMGRSMLNWARLQKATGKSPVYLDMFARGKATHGADLAYWFDILDLPGAPSTPDRPIGPLDHAVAVKMDDALVAFVKTGDPNTAAVKWPQFTRDNEVQMVFGDPVGVQPVDPGVKFFVENPEIMIGRLGVAAGPTTVRQGPL